MGQIISKAKSEGKYQMILAANGVIMQSPGRPGDNSESPDNVLHLTVHDWRKPSRAFSLELAAGVPSSEFQFEADYESDVLHFWFKLHGQYQGGRQELLRRTQRLFKEDNILGISQIFLGSAEMGEALASLKKTHNRRNNWRPAVVREGCSSTWLKRSEAVDRAYYKFVADKEESSILIVDCTNEEYKALVGGKAEKFFLVMTIPVRIWMCTVLAMRRFNETKNDPSLDGLVDKLGAIHDQTESDGATEHMMDSQVHLFLRRCMEERTMERSATAQQVSQNPMQSQGRTSENGALGSGAEGQEAEAPALKASKQTLKKRRQKERKRMLREEQLREEAEKLAALKEANERARHEQSVHDIAAATEELAFITAPHTPAPHSPSSQHLSPKLLLSPSLSPRSCFSEPVSLPIFHTPPPAMRSFSCPPLSQRSPRKAISPLLMDSQMGCLATAINIGSAPRHGVAAEPDYEAHGISTREIIMPGRPASNINQSQSPAIDNKTTYPQTEISTRSDRRSSLPAQTLSHPLRGSAAVFEPRVPYRTGRQDDIHPNSGDSHATIRASSQPPPARTGRHDDKRFNSDDLQATITASTQPVPPRRASKKSKRKKANRSNTRNRSADKGLSPIQEQHADDDESRQKGVKMQDRAVIDAVSQRVSQPTHHQPSPSKLGTSFTQKTSKDKGKARVSEISAPESVHSLLDTAISSTSADIQSCPEDALSCSEATATSRASPSSKYALTEMELLKASADFWAPVGPATDPAKGESSKMAVTRAKTPSFFAVVPAVPILQGASTQATPAKTPSSRAAVPAGTEQGDASSSRTTKATTPGPSTAVTAGTGGDEFAQGAYPATTPGGKNAVPAGPSPGNVLVTPASITDRSAPTSHAHAQNPTLNSTAPESTEDVNQEEPEDNSWFDPMYHGFKCQLPSCEKRCTLWDNRCVNCPACGPFSYAIYCSKEHLREDVKHHWTICGQMNFDRPCIPDVPDRALVGPPQIQSVHEWSQPEQHRQAMYFCTARQEGDYFIFADYFEQMSAGVPLGQQVELRCLPRVLFTVTFTDEAEKDRFRRVLAVCLMLSLEVHPLACFLFRLIRDWFKARGEWDNSMDGALRYQFEHELGIRLTDGDTGDRHACEAEWTGNLRLCRDPTCMDERPDFMAEIGWSRGFRQMVDALEANHWLLRAHRTTHPTVQDVAARTRGQGFADVLPQDQRLFARGEGWDGFETGPMELEESLTGWGYCHP